MNAKLGVMVIVLLLSSAVAGCPGLTTVPDDGAVSDGSGTDGSAADGALPDGSDGASADGAGDGAATDGDATDGDAADGSDGDSDGGQDGSGGDDGGAPLTFQARGTYSGQLDCTISESLNGEPGNVTQETRAISITFSADGLPDALMIPGYRPEMQFVAEVNQVGEVVELNQSSGEYQATLTVTVGVATYSAASARIVLNLAHFGQQGNLTEEGTGTQVIQMELDGGMLMYSSLTAYDVELRADTLSFDTTREFDCEGTLEVESTSDDSSEWSGNGSD